MNMQTTDTGHVDHPSRARRGAPGRLVCCVIAATLAAAPAATQAAVPKAGTWESGSNSDPRVSFDVRGPARARTVQRVSFPIACNAARFPIGWGWPTIVRGRRGGRFTAYTFGSVIRGRFPARERAEVAVRPAGLAGCTGTRRYVVRFQGRRLAIR